MFQNFYIYSEDYYGDVDLKALRKIGYRRWLRTHTHTHITSLLEVWTKDILYTTESKQKWALIKIPNVLSSI